MRSFVLLLVLTAVLVGTALWPQEAEACSCASGGSQTKLWERPVAHLWDRYDNVFQGTVVKVYISERYIGSEEVESCKGLLEANKVEVQRVWKGERYQTLYLTSYGCCPRRLVIGEAYLFYTSGYSLHSCGWTLDLTTAMMWDLKILRAVLGSGQKPYPDAVRLMPREFDDYIWRELTYPDYSLPSRYWQFWKDNIPGETLDPSDPEYLAR